MAHSLLPVQEIAVSIADPRTPQKYVCEAPLLDVSDVCIVQQEDVQLHRVPHSIARGPRQVAINAFAWRTSRETFPLRRL